MSRLSLSCRIVKSQLTRTDGHLKSEGGEVGVGPVARVSAGSGDALSPSAGHLVVAPALVRARVPRLKGLLRAR